MNNRLKIELTQVRQTPKTEFGAKITEGDVDLFRMMYRELVRVAEKVDSIRGDGVTTTDRNVVITGARGDDKLVVRSRSTGQFWAKITGSTQDGTNKRWVYDIVEVRKTSTGYGGWTEPDEAIEGEAYNLCEVANGATGLFGNGVDSANLSGTFDIQPVPDDSIVWVSRVPFEGEGVEFWFERINGIDGAC